MRSAFAPSGEHHSSRSPGSRRDSSLPARRTLLPVLVIVLQAVLGPSMAGAGPLPTHHLLLAESQFNDRDLFLGGSYRYATRGALGIGPFVSFSGRVERLTLLQRVGPHFFYQRQEVRFFGAVGVDGSYPTSGVVGVFGTAGAGYTYGNYSGTETRPKSGWTPVLRAGVLCRFGSRMSPAHVRVGYQYADLRSVPSNRIFAALGVEF